MNTTTELHVIFGTGPLGKWTARELARQGKRVRLINRSGQASDLPEGAEVVKADAYDARQTTELTVTLRAHETAVLTLLKQRSVAMTTI